MKTKLKDILGIAALGLIMLATTTPTWAGKVYNAQVQLGSNQISRYASGSMVGARYSPDIWQYITCSAIANGGLTTTECSARNSTGYVACRSQDPKFQEVIHSMTDSSYVYFVADLNGNCTNIVIYHGSDLLK